MNPALLARARVRPARSEDDLARAEAFLKTPRMREVVEAHPEERGCVRLCEADGEILGALLIDPSPLRVRDVEVRCARVHETGGEDGRLHFRSTGDDELFVFLIEEFLGYLWARRYPIAYVHGELALFPAHGFVPCFYHPRVFVDTAAAVQLPRKHRVRHLKSDDIQPILELRENDRAWKPVVFATGVPLFHHFCIEGPGREILGCFSLELNGKSEWNPTFFVPEVDVADRDAACTLLRHCAEKAHELGIEEMHFTLGPGHPVARLCLELGGRSEIRGASVNPLLDEEMVHVVDPAWLLEALVPYLERRLAASGLRGASGTVTFVTEKGRWTIEIDEGFIAVGPAARENPEAVELPHWALTQLLMGYRGVEEVDAEIPRRQFELLSLLLPKSWPFSMCDPDHWRPLEPPIPFEEPARAAVERVRLPWHCLP
jgi:hypothetical protein